MAEEKNISTAEQTAPAPETTEEAVTTVIAEEVVAQAVVEEAVAEETVAEEAVVEVAVAEEAVAEETVVEQTATEEVVAEEVVSDDISDMLKEAAGNIQKASADARTRRSEQEKTNRSSEAEAQERIEEIEKKHQEDERLAQIVAEQKLAALDYAQNYRKKLMKDRQKALSAAKLREREEKEAEAARVREEKAKEIAEMLEKERGEAHERGEKATALLNRVTKCAIIDENGNLRLVDRMDIKKGNLDANGEAVEDKSAETLDKAVIETAPEAKDIPEKKEEPETQKAPTPTTVYAYSEPTSELEAARREVESFLVGEMLDTSDDKFILNIEDDRMVVSLTSEDDPLIAPAGSNPTVEQYAHEIAVAKAQHEYILSVIKDSTEIAKNEMKRIVDEEQQRFNYEMEALNAHRIEIATSHARRRQAVIDEINSFVSAPVSLPKLSACDLNVTRETSEAYESVCESEPVEAVIAENVASAPTEVEEAVVEQTVATTEEAPALEPVASGDPVVAELRAMCEAVTNKKQLKKYLKKSNKAIKTFEKQKSKLDQMAYELGDVSATYVTVCKSIIICAKILEIKCDNVSCVAKITNSRVLRSAKNSLYASIEEYNRKAGDFAAITGEELTRVSAFLPERLADGTGKAVIPALAFKERYEQLKKEEAAPTSYTFTFPSLATLVNGVASPACPTVTANSPETKKNEITLSKVISSPLTADTLVGDGAIKNKRQYKKLLKLAKKANKKLDKEAARFSKIENEKDKSVMLLAIERERALVSSKVFLASLSLGITKFIASNKRDLIDAFIRYNGFARECEQACNTSITAIHSATVEKIADARLLPDMPVMVHLTELYETVGDMTRVVGEPESKSGALDACCTFIFGGAQTPTPQSVAASNSIDGVAAGSLAAMLATASSRVSYANASEVAPVSSFAEEQSAMAAPEDSSDTESAPAPVSETAPENAKAEKKAEKQAKKAAKAEKKAEKQAKKAAKAEKKAEKQAKKALKAEKKAEKNAKKPEACESETEIIEVDRKEKAAPASDKLDASAFGKYKKQSEKSYNATKKELAKLEKERKSLTGEALVDLDVKRLGIVKNLIDSLCDNVAVSLVSEQKSYQKQSKKRLEAEIASHNVIVDTLKANGGITLSKVSTDLYKTVIAGNGYFKTPKFEYHIIEKAPTQTVHIVETEGKENAPKAEYNSKANRAMSVMNKKELSKLLKSSKKEDAIIKEDFANLEKQRAVTTGREKVMLICASLTTQKKAVSLAADNLLAASQVSTSKKQIDKLRKSLNEEIAVYNKVVDEYESLTGDAITKADTEMAEKIVSGRPYTAIPDISCETNTSVYEYDFADFTAYDVKNENDKKLAAAQAHNRVERSNAASYEIAQLSSRIAKQQNKDLELIAARFMFEKGLLQSKNDMLAYRYAVSQKQSVTSEREIARRCKELDDKGKRALVSEEADNQRYYEVIRNNPETVKIKNGGIFSKKYTKHDIADIREKVMQLLNERELINSKLLSIYTGYEVDMDGRAITLEMRKIKTAAAAKEYKKLAGRAKRVSRLSAERRDKQKLYDLLNTQIDAKSTVALAKYRLKHENVPKHEKAQLKKDIAVNTKAAKMAAKRFDWLLGRLKNLGKDMGGSWMMGIGLLLVVLIGAIAAFLYFFGADFFGAIGSTFGL